MKRPLLILMILALSTIPAVILSVSLGSVSIPLSDVLNILLGNSAGISDADRLIVIQLRLTRIMAALFVGGGLSTVGVAMQALVRNPLAEPYILGISSGASAGASLFYLGFLPPVLALWLSLPAAAFAGALISITAVYLIARTGGRISTSKLLLAGVAMASFMASITSFITYASPDPNRLRAVLFWMLGSLSGYSWQDLILPATVSVGGFVAFLLMARQLDALLLGDEQAVSLGVRVELLKKALIVLAALVVGILVANSGTIGFVGLIVPHIVRALVGVNHRYVLPASYLAGGLFLMLADLIGQLILPGQIIPVGIITAIAGVPFFLFILRRSQYKFA